MSPSGPGPPRQTRLQVTGTGIPPTSWPRVFNRFWRSRQASQTSGSGSGSGCGTGLAVAAELTRTAAS
jgi:signal transduction histidine kinase